MDFFVSSGLYSFFANAAIGLFVYTRNPKRPVNIFFALFSLTVSGWSCGSFLENIITNKTIALCVLRSNYLFGAWLPPIYMHSVYAFTERMTRVNKKKLQISYVISALLTPIVFTSAFIPNLRKIEGTDFYISQPGPFYYFFFVFFALSMIEVISHTTFQIRQYHGKQKTQVKYMTVANAIAIFAGFEYFSRVFGLVKSPPLDDYILVAYMIVVAYAIVRHQLMDIEVIIKKTLVFAGLFSFVVACFSIPLFLLPKLFAKSITEGGQFWLLAGSAMVVAGLVRPIHQFLIHATDKYLFQKAFDYRQLLKEASREMAAIKSLKKLAKTVVAFVVSKGRIKRAGAFVYFLTENAYVMQASRPYLQNWDLHVLPAGHSLIQELKRMQGPVAKETLNDRLQSLKESEEKARLKECLKVLQNLKAEAAIPSFLYRETSDQSAAPELRSILFLGPKKSDEAYTPMQSFPALPNTAVYIVFP